MKDKSAPDVAQFLYEIVCCHGCHHTQIDDQEREFVNEVSQNLHRMKGSEQRVTLPFTDKWSVGASCDNLFGKSIARAISKVVVSG